MCRWCVALAQWWDADFTGAIAQFRELVAESEAAHDEIWRWSSLVGLGHVLAEVATRARPGSRQPRPWTPPRISANSTRAIAYAALAVANLAARDVEAAAGRPDGGRR